MFVFRRPIFAIAPRTSFKVCVCVLYFGIDFEIDLVIAVYFVDCVVSFERRKYLCKFAFH